MIVTKDEREFFDVPDRIITEKNSYEIQDRIGAGGNSAVYECIDREGNEYAIKLQLNLSSKSIKRFQQEIKVLYEINHPNIVKYIDHGKVKGEKQNRNNEKCEIWFIVMEKAEQNLKEYIKERGSIIYAEYMPQFLGLSKALGVLHSRAIHRDIKLENILVIGEKWVLSDLGLCTFLSDEEHEDLTKMYEKIGPKYWMSPEAINRIYNNEDEIVTASDVFQLSAVFWYVVTNRYPLGIVTEDDWGDDEKEICKVLLKGLSHNITRRTNNGEELFLELESVRNNLRE